MPPPAIQTLRDIRTNVEQYVDAIVPTISPLTLSSGNTLNPNETFTFTVDVGNGAAALGVRLINVRLRLEVGGAVAKLLVPDFAPGQAGTNVTDLNGNPILAPGGWVNGFIIHFPAGHAWDALNPGENVPALQFTGRAQAIGNTNIHARIIADVDHAWLWPNNQESNSGTRAVSVT